MRFLRSIFLAVGLVFAATLPAQAQFQPQNEAQAARVAAAGQPRHGFSDARPIGIGLVIIGAAVGIGWLTRSAVESMARQPEIAANIQTAMIISAALIEGVTFFALIILMLFAQPW
jgi:F-type H+-transporting ATPase subunit c